MPGLVGELREPVAVGDAGIVDDDIDGAERGLGAIERAGDLRGIRHVEGDRDGNAAMRRDLGGKRLQPVDATGGDGDLGAGARERQREVAAETGRCAGDERHLAVERERLIDRHDRRRVDQPAGFLPRKSRLASSRPDWRRTL